MPLKRKPLGRCTRLPMRLLRYLSVATLVACAPSAPYPLPGSWAHLPAVRTRGGDSLSLGLSLPRTPDSTYNRPLVCGGHAPCSRESATVYVFAPNDPSFINRIEAGTDSQNLIIYLDIQFDRSVPFDSAVRLYRSVLGHPQEIGSDLRAYYPYAEWRRDDLRLRLFGTSPTRGAPVTAYLSRYERLYGFPQKPDIAWQLRACEEYSYLFCSNIRE
jgi:hypothetical protein